MIQVEHDWSVYLAYYRLCNLVVWYSMDSYEESNQGIQVNSGILPCTVGLCAVLLSVCDHIMYDSQLDAFDLQICVDINECDDAAPCQANFACNNTDGAYECYCPDGYMEDGERLLIF